MKREGRPGTGKWTRMAFPRGAFGKIAANYIFHTGRGPRAHSGCLLSFPTLPGASTFHKRPKPQEFTQLKEIRGRLFIRLKKEIKPHDFFYFHVMINKWDCAVINKKALKHHWSINNNIFSHFLSHVISTLMHLAFSKGLWVTTTIFKQMHWPEMPTICHLLAVHVWWLRLLQHWLD